MRNFMFWQRWLLAVSIFIIAFGLFMAFFNQSAPFDLLFNRQVDPLFFSEGISAEAARFQGWAYGVLGATMAGWGVFFTFIVQFPFKQKEPWAWSCMLTGLVLWVVVDSGISIAYGVWFNVAFNSIFLILVGLPLLATRKHFSSKD